MLFRSPISGPTWNSECEADAPTSDKDTIFMASLVIANGQKQTQEQSRQGSLHDVDSGSGADIAE